jgi:hypothetical protein
MRRHSARFCIWRPDDWRWQDAAMTEGYLARPECLRPMMRFDQAHRSHQMPALTIRTGSIAVSLATLALSGGVRYVAMAFAETLRTQVERFLREVRAA